METNMYQSCKKLLKSFPGSKAFLKQTYRSLRTGYLKMRHPKGGFMMCNGARVFCDFSDNNYCWYDGDSAYLNFEQGIFMSLFDHRAPDVILDVGAHWGFYPAFLDSSLYAKKIKKIISIEADPVNCKLLSETLGNIRSICVEQIDGAISDRDGFVDLYSGVGECRQTYRSSAAIASGKVRAISLDTLVDSFLTSGEQLTHVKLDIDGYEPAFFAGGRRALKKFNPIIFMEFWAKGIKAAGWDMEAYWSMLHNNYCVKEACFSSRSLVPLSHKDLSYLIDKTMDGITNLVLIPKK